MNTKLHCQKSNFNTNAFRFSISWTVHGGCPTEKSHRHGIISDNTIVVTTIYIPTVINQLIAQQSGGYLNNYHHNKVHTLVE